MTALIDRHTSLSANLVHFCRYLRSKGFSITTDQEQDALTAMQEILPVSEDLYISLLRATLCKDAHQYIRFKEIYLDYQYEMDKAVDAKIKNVAEEKPGIKSSNLPSFEALKSWLYHQNMDDSIELSAYSGMDVLVKKDFSMLTDEEIEFLSRMLQRLAASVLRRRSRLHRISRKRKHINLVKTLRKNIRSGIEIRDIVYSEPKIKKLKLVLLCDVSRSMDLYSRFFVQMMYAFQTGYDRMETFVFSTSLYEISDILLQHEFTQAFRLIEDRVPKWSGGTKIGASLQSFCDHYAHRKLDRKTVVLILSDGWDTGDQELMKNAMQRIHRLSRKIIWLNPLAGNPEFRPEVMGLKNVLPYIHKLHPAHNLESLKKAMRLL